MELVRQKNIATIITFPLVDADGDAVTGAGALDSNIDAWADGSVPDGFVACTNEATEIGATGVYYLSLTQAEMNVDYVYITIASTSAKKQHILIRTMVGDPLNLSVHNAAAIWSAGSRALTTPNDYKATGFSVHNAAAIWSEVTKEITGGALTTPADYKATGFSTHNADAIWSVVTREITGGVLTTPADYKANVSALALEATVNALNNLSSANVQTVVETNDLDHLIKVAHPTGDPVTNSLMDLIMNKDGTQTFARADDSLQGISEGAAGGGASAQEVWEYASPRTLTTPADYKASVVGLSTHAAADIWSVGTKVITGGVLTTPADYKANISGLSTHTAANVWSVATKIITGGVLTTPANYKADVSGLSTHNAAAIWSEVTKVITGGVLTTPADYKADVSALATATNLQIVDDNVDAVLIDTGTTIPAELLRLRGLNGEFIVAEYTFVGNDNTAIAYWQYDTEANFNTHDKATGLIGSWILNNTFVSNNPTVAKSKRLS